MRESDPRRENQSGGFRPPLLPPTSHSDSMKGLSGSELKERRPYFTSLTESTSVGALFGSQQEAGLALNRTEEQNRKIHIL